MKNFSPSLFDSVEPGPRKAHKRQILSSALACFNELGIEATTIEAIRTRADSSVGSIYHHFGNKEGLIAALCFAALDDQLNLIQPRMKSAGTPREAIGQLIHSYLEWVTQKPELARFLSQARHAVATGPFGKALGDRNKQRYGDLHKWLSQGVNDGAILALPKKPTHPCSSGRQKISVAPGFREESKNRRSPTQKCSPRQRGERLEVLDSKHNQPTLS